MKNKLLRLLLGMAIFGILIAMSDISEITSNLLNSDPVYIILALFITPLTMHLRAIRLHEILLIHNERIPLVILNKLCYVGFLFGVITPSRAGDFIRAYYLTKENKVPYAHSTASIFIDRILDLITLLLLVNLALIHFPYFLENDIFRNFIWLSPAITLILILFLYMLTREWFLDRTINFLETLFRRLIKKDRYMKDRHTKNRDVGEMALDREEGRIALDREEGKISREFHITLQNLKNSKKRFLPIIFINTVLWFFILLQTQLILMALGENVDIIFTFLAIPFTILAALIPVTLSGLGTRDAAMVALFSLVGVTASKSISLAIIFLFMGQLLPALIGGYFYLKRGYSNRE